MHECRLATDAALLAEQQRWPGCCLCNKASSRVITQEVHCFISQISFVGALWLFSICSGCLGCLGVRPENTRCLAAAYAFGGMWFGAPASRCLHLPEPGSLLLFPVVASSVGSCCDKYFYGSFSAANALTWSVTDAVELWSWQFVASLLLWMQINYSGWLNDNHSHSAEKRKRKLSRTGTNITC